MRRFPCAGPQPQPLTAADHPAVVLVAYGRATRRKHRLLQRPGTSDKMSSRARGWDGTPTAGMPCRRKHELVRNEQRWAGAKRTLSRGRPCPCARARLTCHARATVSREKHLRSGYRCRRAATAHVQSLFRGGNDRDRGDGTADRRLSSALHFSSLRHVGFAPLVAKIFVAKIVSSAGPPAGSADVASPSSSWAARGFAFASFKAHSA